MVLDRYDRKVKVRIRFKMIEMSACFVTLRARKEYD